MDPRLPHPLPRPNLQPKRQVPLAGARSTGQLIISDAILEMFSRRADVVREFPFVSIKKPAKSGCRCKQAPGEGHLIAKEMERIKQTIANQPLDRLARFKAILGVREIALWVRGPKGSQKRIL